MILIDVVTDKDGRKTEVKFGECVKLRDGTVVMAVAQRSPRPNLSTLEYQALTQNRSPDAKSVFHHHLTNVPGFCDVIEVRERSKGRQLKEGEEPVQHPYWTDFIDENGNVVKVCISIALMNQLTIYYREARVSYADAVNNVHRTTLSFCAV